MITESAGDSGGAAPASPVGASPNPAPATPESSSPGTTAAAGVSTEPPKGPIPYERFEEINKKYNALKWAETHDSQRVTQQAQFFRWLDSDPEGAFQYMENYLQRNGVLKPRQAAPTGNGQPQSDGRPQPDIVVPETGQRFYSAEANEKLAEWKAREATKSLDERLAKFEAAQTRSQYQSEAARQLKEMESRPYYKEHETEILREMERDRRLTLEGAYNRVVVPKIRELERQSVLEEIKQKSHASTASPQRQSASQGVPSAKLSWSDVFKREMAKRGGRA